MGGSVDRCPLCNAVFKVPRSPRQQAELKYKAAAEEASRKEAEERACQEQRAKRDAVSVRPKEGIIGAALAISPRMSPAKRVFAPVLVPPWAIEMADDLKRDFDRLSELGVNLDQAAAVARPAGVGAGIYVAFRVHPLLGAAIAGVALLAKVGTDAWKQVKIDEVRQKWMRTLTGMNEERLTLFAMAIQTRYPLLLPAATQFLPQDAR